LKDISSDEIKILQQFFPQGVVAFDLETTGLSPLVDKIIEISAVKVTKDGIETFDQLVNPEIKIPEFTIDIHHITDDMVKDSPKIQEVLPEFVNFIENFPLIAHNAKFDVGFIVYDILQNKLSLPEAKVYCSCVISRRVFKDFPNHKLGTLVEKLEIPLENHHRALDDAKACLQVFAKALLSYYEKKNNMKILGDAFLFKTNSFGADQDLKIPKHLKKLEEIVPTQAVIDIKYNGGSMKGKFRPVKPISLLPMPDGLILYAHCLTSNIFKSFAVRKITDFMELSDEEKEYRLESLNLLNN
jgi:DNA polymerase-3 subunit epsilon